MLDFFILQKVIVLIIFCVALFCVRPSECPAVLGTRYYYYCHALLSSLLTAFWDDRSIYTTLPTSSECHQLVPLLLPTFRRRSGGFTAARLMRALLRPYPRVFPLLYRLFCWSALCAVHNPSTSISREGQRLFATSPAVCVSPGPVLVSRAHTFVPLRLLCHLRTAGAARWCGLELCFCARLAGSMLNAVFFFGCSLARNSDDGCE